MVGRKALTMYLRQLGLGSSAKTALSIVEQAKSFDNNIVVKSILTTRVVEGT